LLDAELGIVTIIYLDQGWWTYLLSRFTWIVEYCWQAAKNN